jgi:hypothetical protein
LAVVLLVASACGGGDGGGADAGAAPGADACQARGPGGVVYLNREGGTFAPGPESSVDNTTSATGEEREVLPHPYSDSAWNLLAECVADGLAPFDIELVESDPGDIDHTELVFTQESWVGEVGAFSAFSCAGFPRGIAFVFGETFSGDVPGECAAALRQLGSVAAGLDHVIGCDYMGLDDDCELRWVDDDLTCGDLDQRDCVCGGATQNSYQKMLATFGPSCL